MAQQGRDVAGKGGREVEWRRGWMVAEVRRWGVEKGGGNEEVELEEMGPWEMNRVEFDCI